jgi:diacylglycerol kinase (ATP)
LESDGGFHGEAWLSGFDANRQSFWIFRAAWKYESAFRQEVVLTGALIPFAFSLGSDPVEIAMLVASLLLVVIVELLNSGIEAVVDRIGDEPHKLSGRAKDM